MPDNHDYWLENAADKELFNACDEHQRNQIEDSFLRALSRDVIAELEAIAALKTRAARDVKEHAFVSDLLERWLEHRDEAVTRLAIFGRIEPPRQE